MYFVGKLLHDEAEWNEPHYNGSWLSEQEKRRVIDEFYSGVNARIPLSFDHQNIGMYGFVPQADVIGELIDLFNNRDGDLMAKIGLSSKNDAVFGDILRGMHDGKVKWGLSVGLAQFHHPETGQRSRELTHVAITANPGFADRDTYLYNWSVDEDILNDVIAREFYQSNDERAYASPAFEEKLKCMSGTIN